MLLFLFFLLFSSLSQGTYFGSIAYRFLQFLDPIRKKKIEELNVEFYLLNIQAQNYGLASKLYGLVVLLSLFQVLKFAAMSTKVNLMWLTVHRAGEDKKFFSYSFFFFFFSFHSVDTPLI